MCDADCSSESPLRTVRDDCFEMEIGRADPHTAQCYNPLLPAQRCQSIFNGGQPKWNNAIRTAEGIPELGVPCC
jgi:hypothetical protein